MTESNLLSNKTNPWEMEIFWEKHKRRIVAGAIVLGVVAAITIGFFIRDYHARQASRTLLSRASTSEELQTVVSKYPASDAAASAVLLLAANQRQEGELDEANSTYQKFLKRSPKHALAGEAALGIAENALAAGRQDEGLAHLQTLAAKYPTSYTAPFALYVQASLLAFQPGQAQEARKRLQDLTRQFPDSGSARQAASLLILLGGTNIEEVVVPKK